MKIRGELNEEFTVEIDSKNHEIVKLSSKSESMTFHKAYIPDIIKCLQHADEYLQSKGTPRYVDLGCPNTKTTRF